MGKSFPSLVWGLLTNFWPPSVHQRPDHHKVEGTQNLEQEGTLILGNLWMALPALLARTQDVYFFLLTCFSYTLTWTLRAPALLWVLVYPAPAGPVLDPQAWTLESHAPHQILRKLSLDKTNNWVCWFKLSVGNTSHMFLLRFSKCLELEFQLESYERTELGSGWLLHTPEKKWYHHWLQGLAIDAAQGLSWALCRGPG